MNASKITNVLATTQIPNSPRYTLCKKKVPSSKIYANLGPNSSVTTPIGFPIRRIINKSPRLAPKLGPILETSLMLKFNIQKSKLFLKKWLS